MKNIIVVASIEIKEEFIKEVYYSLVELHTKTHQYDEGCIQYELHQDIEFNNRYTFIETWKDIHSLEAHSKKEHFLKFVQFIEGKLISMNVQKLYKEKL